MRRLVPGVGRFYGKWQGYVEEDGKKIWTGDLRKKKEDAAYDAITWIAAQRKAGG